MIDKDQRPTRDVAREVTDKIIAALQSGASPWQRPWSLSAAAYPHNARTKKKYRGINVTLLMLAQTAGAYTSSGWLTEIQAQQLRGNVREGEQGEPVIFFMSWKKTQSGSGESSKSIPMLRQYIVFNVEQCEHLPARITQPSVDGQEEIPNIAVWVEKTLDCNVQHGGDEAFYAPGNDLIQMPSRSKFTTESGYIGTLLHEATHCTGAKARLNRFKAARFGSDNFAKEELVAEIGSSMLCAMLGFDYEVEHHASYIDSWLQVLKDDQRYILRAAYRAQKALDYILERAGLAEPQNELGVT